MSTRGNSTRKLSRMLAGFNRKVANPVVRLLAGRLPPLAIVLHRGRTTGRNFGTVSDWVRSLQASGGVQDKRRGTTCSYGQPRLVSRNDGLQLAPGFLRGPFRALGVQNFLRLSLITPDDPRPSVIANVRI
jgi:hypothetical protein